MKNHATETAGGRSPFIWNLMSELDTQFVQAEFAYNALVMALSERSADDRQERARQRKAVFFADAFLSHASMAAALFWPGSASGAGFPSRAGDVEAEAWQSLHDERGNQLRLELGDDARVLRQLARAGYLQRYEDRVDAWAVASETGPVLDLQIASPDDDAPAVDQPPLVLRRLDPKTLIYTLLDQPFDLPAIAAELIATHRAVGRWVVAQGA